MNIPERRSRTIGIPPTRVRPVIERVEWKRNARGKQKPRIVYRKHNGNDVWRLETTTPTKAQLARGYYYLVNIECLGDGKIDFNGTRVTPINPVLAVGYEKKLPKVPAEVADRISKRIAKITGHKKDRDAKHERKSGERKRGGSVKQGKRSGSHR